RLAQSFRDRNLHGRVKRERALLAGGLDHGLAQRGRLRRGSRERLGKDGAGRQHRRCLEHVASGKLAISHVRSYCVQIIGACITGERRANKLQRFVRSARSAPADVRIYTILVARGGTSSSCRYCCKTILRLRVRDIRNADSKNPLDLVLLLRAKRPWPSFATISAKTGLTQCSERRLELIISAFAACASQIAEYTRSCMATS